MPLPRLAAVLLLLAAIPASHAAPVPDRVDFNFHIRPLLSDRCFACHGPDDKARKGGLSLLTRDAALRGGKSGKASLVPGKPEESELYRRLVTPDPDDLMPPPESKLPKLTSAEIETIRRWIAQGGDFKEHWAFLPLQPVEPPAATVPEGNEIDRFVVHRLASEGLAPQPRASRETLVRRLTLDLTGLPPSPSEIDAFLGDESPQAYEKLVDRLLDSPRYGEWMAVEWMDLARFADTYGYQADVDIDLSPWRDWVIRAFNQNLPWDQFITWQLAGDLLDRPSREQRLATAFNRLHRQTNEGGSIEDEFRKEYVADRVHTFGTAFLGLTLECARCHDHKYDPVSQRDYYGLASFFNAIDESGLYSHFTRATPTPVLFLSDDATDAALAKARETAASARARLGATRQTALAGPSAPDLDARPLPPLPAPVVHLSFETIQNGALLDSASTNRVTLQDGPQLAPGQLGNALRFSGDNTATVSHVGQFGRTDPFSIALWLQPTEKQSRAVVFHASRAWTDSGSRGFELVLDEGRPFFALIHFWPGNAIAVRARDPLPLDAWSHLTVTYDGSSSASGIRLYRDGHRLDTEIVRDHLYKDIQHRQEWGDADAGRTPLTLAGRFRDSGFKNGLIDEFQVFATELVPGEVRLLPGLNPPASLDPALAKSERRERILVRSHPEYLAALASLQEARVAENKLVTPIREIMTMEEMPNPRPTHVLRRGAYDAEGDLVPRAVPERLFPFDPALPRNRLGLARWLTHPNHPLTARVAVNRVWKLHFGRGLSATTWDLGAQGTLPSHPELLDWLAHRFVQSGWNRKALHKLVVTSATYRQNSTAPASLVERDPENRLLARGPRHRLAAEQIRDAALAASGLLVPTIGGPSVKPYQPPGVWEEAGTGKTYVQDKGDKLYRRSLYTFWRRTAPPASMLTFDAPTREVCAAKREPTTTPLQSLLLLNDPQFLEAARVLAERLLADHAKAVDARIVDAFRRLAGRRPDARETDILRRLYQEQKTYFEAHPEAAAKYLAIGEKPRNTALPVPDLAATTVLASTLMNHDAFVMKR